MSKRLSKLIGIAFIFAFALGMSPEVDAQVQPFLKARNPFIWDGVAGQILLGAEESSISIATASIVTGLYGELNWDIENLLGSEKDPRARAPSFLFKVIPFHTLSDTQVGNLLTLSVGTRALSGVDLFAGWGTYLQNGRFALGLGLDLKWDKMEDGRLVSPSASWLGRSHFMLTPRLGVDAAATLHDGDIAKTDVAVVYKLFAPHFHLYAVLMDLFSHQVDRRVGLSYAIDI
jgi:hypothetical protein